MLIFDSGEADEMMISLREIIVVLPKGDTLGTDGTTVGQIQEALTEDLDENAELVKELIVTSLKEFALWLKEADEVPDISEFPRPLDETWDNVLGDLGPYSQADLEQIAKLVEQLRKSRDAQAPDEWESCTTCNHPRGNHEKADNILDKCLATDCICLTFKSESSNEPK